MSAALRVDPTFRWKDLPLVTTHTAKTAGVIRTTPEAFRVEELPAYLPEGKGSHLYIRVEKRERTTRDLIVALRQAGIQESRIGVAGLKDKYAVTVQWLSVPWADREAASILNEIEGVRVLETSRHRNKLGIGHLRGNRFTIDIRGVEADARASAEQTLTWLSMHGLPNYFGPQRFGRFGRNAIDGLKVLSGERVSGDRRLQRFFVSSVQSWIFNRLLSLRIRNGEYSSLLDGDWARKVETGGTFLVEDATAERVRAEQFEITSLLPLHGRKVRISEGTAGDRELATLDELGISWSQLTGRRGDRRPSRVPVTEVFVEDVIDDAIRLSFVLPKGSYATTLLREVTGLAVDAPVDGD